MSFSHKNKLVIHLFQALNMPQVSFGIKKLEKLAKKKVQGLEFGPILLAP